MWTIKIVRPGGFCGYYARWLCVRGVKLATLPEDASGFPNEKAAGRKAQQLRGYPENRHCAIYAQEYQA